MRVHEGDSLREPAACRRQGCRVTPLHRHGLYSDSLYSDGLYSEGLYSDGLYSYGLYSYGIYSDGVGSYGLRTTRMPCATFAGTCA